MKARIVIAAVAVMCFGASALAAEPAPATKAASAPAPAAPKPIAAPAVKPASAKVLPRRAVGDNAATKSGQKPRTAISLDCSKQADAKGLHGKPREKFRNECKKAGK